LRATKTGKEEEAVELTRRRRKHRVEDTYHGRRWRARQMAKESSSGDDSN
jgi:hypothetical protein